MGNELFDGRWTGKGKDETGLEKSRGEMLKHKESLGKSENLSNIFFAEILVFDHDYEGKSLSSNGLLWISFIKKKKFLFELFFKLFGGPPNKSIHVINYTLQGVIIIKSLI